MLVERKPRPIIWQSLVAVFALGCLVASSSLAATAETQQMEIREEKFGKTSDGRDVTRITLVNSSGHSAQVMGWGATLLEVRVPDRDGKLANVNLVFDDLERYLGRHPYFGSTVGRFSNRIAHAKFTIDGVEYQLDTNHGKHHLHGGKDGFAHQLWAHETYKLEDSVGVRFTYTSPDGEEHYPGTVETVVDYNWNNDNELTIRYRATTDAPTHLNLTNHSYWNLGGVGSGSILDHFATIHADHALDVDDELIPSGKLNPVEGTGLDFRKATAIGERIAEYPGPKGYDHCFAVRGNAGELRPVAEVYDPKSGRVLEIESTQPGVQLYTGNHLAGNESSAGHASHEAFCLETQHFPNAPNIAEFASTLLRPGQVLEETTVHRFSAR